jgi:hypothetical protein
MLRFEHGGFPIMWGRGIRGGVNEGEDKGSVEQAKMNGVVNNNV